MILSNLNERSAREGWVDNGGPPPSRPLWGQQARLDSGVLSRQSLMNDSSTPNLSVQGQGMNLATPNPSSRPQWGGAPRGTILNALEQAHVYDETMSSTASNQTSDISARDVAKRMGASRANDTYVIASVNKPIEEPAKTITDKAEMSEFLATGQFDAKNRSVSTTASEGEPSSRDRCS